MPTERVLRALSMFGLTPDQARDADTDLPRELAAAAAVLDRALRAGAVALVTGPSGAGKSRLLRLLARRLRARNSEPITAPDPRTLARRRSSVVDCFRLPPDGPHGSLRLLAAAGLAEASLFARPVRELSEGQRARLGLALAMHAARRATLTDPEPTLVADEFASCLDRTTAAGLAATLRRWVGAERRVGRCVRAVVATAHDDLLEPLRPDVLVAIDPRGHAQVVSR